MKRDLAVVITVVVAAYLVLAAGVYVAWISTPVPAGPPTYRYVPREWNVSLVPGLTYRPPVLGPTTPLVSDRGGGLWLINSASSGLVQMDLAQYTLWSNTTPFQAGNETLRLNVGSDLGLTFSAPPVLSSLYYVVPGVNLSTTGIPLTYGPLADNGLLAAFLGTTFVVFDPFSRAVVFSYVLPFGPSLTGEDPASAGEMLLVPEQRIFQIGIIGTFVGPYRYFYASDGNHTAIFEINYCHAGVGTGSGSVPPPSGHLVMFMNATLSAPPKVFYDQEYVTPADTYRSGPGQAILFPLANDTLAVYNVSGRARAFMPLTLDGQPAHVQGDIGFTRAPYPMWLYLPLQSPTSTGITVLDLASLRFLDESVLSSTGLSFLGAPESLRAQRLTVASYEPAAGSTRVRAFSLDANGSLAPLSALDWNITGRIRSFFEVQELSKIFVDTESGSVLTLGTDPTTTASLPPEDFLLRPPSAAAAVEYGGSPGGTRFGPGLTPFELVGAWTDSGSARSALFELLGRIQPTSSSSHATLDLSVSTFGSSVCLAASRGLISRLRL